MLTLICTRCDRTQVIPRADLGPLFQAGAWADFPWPLDGPQVPATCGPCLDREEDETPAYYVPGVGFLPAD